MKKTLLTLLTLMAAFGSTAWASGDAKPAPAPSHADQLARGKQIASTVCVACHGLDGMSPIPANPNIGGMPPQYIAKELTAFKAGTRQNPTMQGMVANLSDADMQALGVYYFAQRGKTQAVAGDEKKAKLGQTIYRVGVASAQVPACASCHGATGAGLPAKYPKLAGQWPEYTLAQLQAYASGARKNAEMNAIASRLTADQLQALAQYTAGMRSK